MFEPLQGADFALASTKRVSDIHALLVHLSCAQFFSGYVRMILKPLKLLAQELTYSKVRHRADDGIYLFE